MFVLIDMIGDFNADPGSGWDVAGVTNGTKDHTLVRKCSVTQGNTNWTSSAGTSISNSEWIVLSQDDWSDIGQHTTPCPQVPGCMDSTASNYNPLANVNDTSCTLVNFLTGALKLSAQVVMYCTKSSRFINPSGSVPW